MTLLRWLWLILAVIGAAWPASHLTAWLQGNGWSVSGMINAWQVDNTVKGLSVDLLISGIVLTIWILAEVAVRRNWLALLAIPATFLIGVSCGLPLYLFFRSRPV